MSAEAQQVLPPPSVCALKAVEAIHDERLRRITAGDAFLTIEEEARILDKFWFDHRSQMERTLENELHTANQQLARALSKQPAISP